MAYQYRVHGSLPESAGGSHDVAAWVSHFGGVDTQFEDLDPVVNPPGILGAGLSITNEQGSAAV